MPNIRIHEEVAYIYTRNHKEYDNKYFYLGVLAPDSPNLEGFAPKVERWTAHQRDKDYDEWERKIKKFYIENKDKYNKYFVFGYLFHVITDIVYDRDIYLDVRKIIMKDNVSLEDSHNVMRKDMDYYGTNFKEFDYIKNKLLELDEYYDILNISKEKLEAWTKLNLEEQEKKQPKYINIEIIDKLAKKVEKELN